VAKINSDLTDKMDVVPYPNGGTVKFKVIGGIFNPSQTNGVLHYNLDVDVVGIVAMVSQVDSNLYLSTPTLMNDGWRSTISTAVNAQITWQGIVFYRARN
jgi:hypothetical protein